MHYVTSPNFHEREELLADFGSLTPNKVWARRKHCLSPGLKLKTDKQYAVKPIAANVLDMIDDVGTTTEQSKTPQTKSVCTLIENITRFMVLNTYPLSSRQIQQSMPIALEWTQ